MGKITVDIEGSARHAHLSAEHIEILFGAGHTLTKKKDLSQPGEFACEERLTVVGPKREIAGVTVLGPARARTQVEISLTDARSIGITVPVRESGDIAGSAGAVLVGPAGQVEISEGVIAAKRHLHMSQDDADKVGLKNGQTVCVTVDGPRAVSFAEVSVRVSPKFVTGVHLDTDEFNAAGLTGTASGTVEY